MNIPVSISRTAQGGFVVLLALISYFAIVADMTFLWLIPVILMTGWTIFWRPKMFACLYFGTLPLAIQFHFSDSLGTDLPSEPLMILLSGMIVVYWLQNMRHIHKSIFYHPISLLLFLQWAWILFVALISDHLQIGLKFGAAKTWYIVSLYLLPLLWFDLREIRQLVRIVICVSMPVFLLILYRHSLSGFDFAQANFVSGPFFRNHVVSAVFMLMLVPFIVMECRESTRRWRMWWIFCLIITCLSIYFSYTRAAVGTLLILPVFYLAIRYRLTLVGFGLSFVFLGLIILSLVHENKYLDYAPDYETTVTQGSFEGILEATFQGKDISSMERVYRWVAAGYMVKERPWVGYGPGSFYEHYMPFTVLSFRTYVSDNPERSGLHNQFFMILVERGILGLLLFLAMYLYAMFRAEQLYHHPSRASARQMIVMAYMTLGALFPILLINDLIETDKIGTFFFIALAIITKVDTMNKASLTESTSNAKN